MEGFKKNFWENEEYKEEMDKAGISDASSEDDDGSGAYSVNTRQMLYPSSFESGVRETVLKRDGNRCQGCGSTENLTLDHEIPVSRHFNTEGYKQEPEKRNEWYNDTNNLETLCRACNSRKGGEPYDQEKVGKCARAGKM